MNDVPISLAIPVVVALTGAIAHLWLVVEARNKRCEARSDALDSDLQKLKDQILNKSYEERERAEIREQKAHDRNLEIAMILQNTTDVTLRVSRILKRYDPDPTPSPLKKPNEETTDFHEHELVPYKKKEKTV